MEKRIKLPTPSKVPIENMKKQDFPRISSSSKSSSVSKERPAKKIPKEMNEINVKRSLLNIETQQKPLRKLKTKDVVRRNRAQSRQKDDGENSSDDRSQEYESHEKKIKKLKNNKFEEKIINIQSQGDEVDAHSELTDEETQTSKAEENNNANRIPRTQMIPNVMDQFGLGQSFGEQLFDQQNALSSESPLLKEKSNKSDHLGNSSFLQEGRGKNETRQGHYSNGDKPLRIVKTEYNESKNDVVFTMNWKKSEQSHIRPRDSQITREDLLKYDPLLLVYYYEKHLEFTQYPDQPDFDLERLPH